MHNPIDVRITAHTARTDAATDAALMDRISEFVVWLGAEHGPAALTAVTRLADAIADGHITGQRETELLALMAANQWDEIATQLAPAHAA